MCNTCQRNQLSMELYCSAVTQTPIYRCNMEVYVGKQPEDPFQFFNKPHAIAICIVSPIFGSGKNLTSDNWYTSVPLAEELLKKKVTLVGTIRKNNQTFHEK